MVNTMSETRRIAVAIFCMAVITVAVGCGGADVADGNDTIPATAGAAGAPTVADAATGGEFSAVAEFGGGGATLIRLSTLEVSANATVNTAGAAGTSEVLETVGAPSEPVLVQAGPLDPGGYVAFFTECSKCKKRKRIHGCKAVRKGNKHSRCCVGDRCVGNCGLHLGHCKKGCQHDGK